jgi:predicted RNA-binding protein
MCEFKVFLDGEKIMEDVVFAKVDDGKVTISDVIGKTKVFESVDIVEVNVLTVKLNLKSRQT